jgi:hypothetical protein
VKRNELCQLFLRPGGRRISRPFATAPVVVVLLLVELLLMRVAIRIAVGIYERANARSGPLSSSSAAASVVT